MKQNERTAVNKLIELNTAHTVSLCEEYAKASDGELEQLIATGIQDELRIIQKLKGMLV